MDGQANQAKLTAPELNGVVTLNGERPAAFAFSICTLMTDAAQYADAVRSFRAAGFDGDCEYLCIDNSAGNAFDAFQGCNLFLSEARGRHVIIAHQDVLICHDDRAALEARLRELDALDPNWALCGNSGGVALGQASSRISDPHGEDTALGSFPQRVVSLDENFIVVKRSANLGVSRDLAGFHMYGPDLCVLADVRGYSAYVIDFHLRHLSGGKWDGSFKASGQAFAAKYHRAFRTRWLATPATSVLLCGNVAWRWLARTRIARRLRAWRHAPARIGHQH